MPTVQERFRDKVALVTGAGSGIGRATALAFAREGARVVVACRTADAGQATVRQIEAGGGEALFVATDVTRDPEVEALVRATVDRFGRLDCAFNNAGQMQLGEAPLPEQSEARFDAIMDSDVRGTFLCMKHEIPALLAGGGGAVVNCASAFAHIGGPGGAFYTAAKHAVLGLTRSTALEYAKRGVRVNAVSPGAVDTEGSRAFNPADPAAALAAAAARHPIGRVGRPEEIAAAVLFLCSDEASFALGTDVAVDGGLTAQ